MRHLVYLLNGAFICVGFCAMLVALMAILFGPAILASEYSGWYLLLYSPMVITLMYLSGKDGI